MFAEAIWELGSPVNTLELGFLFLPGAAVHVVWMFGFPKQKEIQSLPLEELGLTHVQQIIPHGV